MSDQIPSNLTMKHVLYLITTTIALAFGTMTPAAAQQSRTLKTEMEAIHESLGVNFVYDSDINIDVPYSGKPMKLHNSDQASLELCLQTLFAGTGIDYEIMRKYIVLTRAGQKRRPKNYTIFIEEQRDTLSESRITAYLAGESSPAQTGYEYIDASVFKRGFAALSAPDVLKTLQTLPGVAGGTELMNGLYVHGGTGNDNLYLYDGVPLYSVSHLAGLYSSFNTDIVDNVNFYKSGFPASYGGRLSSVVEVNSRDGSMTDYMGSFTVGLINGAFQYEGPIIKDRTSFNVALRRSWLEVLSVPGLAIYNSLNDWTSSDLWARYAMTDFNAKVTHRFSDTGVLRVGAVAGNDLVSISEELIDLDLTYKFRWGNILAYADVQDSIGENLDYDAKVYYTHHRSRMDWDKVITYGEASADEVYEDWISGIHDIGLKADFRHDLHPQHKLKYGLEHLFHIYTPKQSWYTQMASDDAPISQGEIAERYFGTETALYVHEQMTPAEWFAADLGLRAVLFGVKGRAYARVEPRAAICFKPFEMWSVKASYTEMNQFAHRLTTTFIDLPSAVWMPSTADIEPMLSRQVALGTNVALPHNISIEVEGFYKTMEHIREYKGYRLFPPIQNWEHTYVEGRGRAYGMEASVVYNTVKTHAAVNYTLSWSERLFEDIFPTWFPDRLDNRHRLNLSVSHRFTDRFEMYLGWNWHSGDRITTESQSSPSTGLHYYTGPNNATLPDYHRLDVGFNFHKTTRRGNEAIWNLSIYNVYCRMNAMVVWDLRDRYEAVGLVPILPTFSYTLKFRK